MLNCFDEAAEIPRDSAWSCQLAGIAGRIAGAKGCRSGRLAGLSYLRRLRYSALGIFSLENQEMTISRSPARSREDIRVMRCFKCGGPHYHRDKLTGWVCGGKPKDGPTTPPRVQGDLKNLHSSRTPVPVDVRKTPESQDLHFVSSKVLNAKLDQIIGLLNTLTEVLASGAVRGAAEYSKVIQAVVPVVHATAASAAATVPQGALAAKTLTSKNPPVGGVGKNPPAASLPRRDALPAKTIPRADTPKEASIPKAAVTSNSQPHCLAGAGSAALTAAAFTAPAAASHPRVESKRASAAAQAAPSTLEPSGGGAKDGEDIYARAFSSLEQKRTLASEDPPPPREPRESDFLFRGRPGHGNSEWELDRAPGVPLNHRRISRMLYEVAQLRWEAHRRPDQAADCLRWADEWEKRLFLDYPDASKYKLPPYTD